MHSSPASAHPPPSTQASHGVRCMADGAWARLSGLRNLPMDAPSARPVAMAVGALLGGTVALVAGAIAPLPAAVLGALLGETSLLLSRADRCDEQQHPQRVRMLQAYPALREVGRQKGLRYDDREQVRRVHDALQQHMQTMVETYRRHCTRHGLPANEVLDNVLKAFYLSFCLDVSPCIITRPKAGWRYIAAVEKALLPALEHAIHVLGVAPELALREGGYPFMRLDLLGAQLRGAAGFRVAREAREWQVIPTLLPDAEPLVDCYGPTTTAMIDVQRRITTLRSRKTQVPDPPSPAVVDATKAPVATVRLGERLQDQLAHLPVDNVTRRGIADLQQDLRHGRQAGHRITRNDEAWMASDARIQGLKGRNTWRVLYRRTGDTYTLEGIGDYHDSATIAWWNG